MKHFLYSLLLLAISFLILISCSGDKNSNNLKEGPEKAGADSSAKIESEFKREAVIGFHRDAIDLINSDQFRAEYKEFMNNLEFEDREDLEIQESEYMARKITQIGLNYGIPGQQEYMMALEDYSGDAEVMQLANLFGMELAILSTEALNQPKIFKKLTKDLQEKVKSNLKKIEEGKIGDSSKNTEEE